MMRSPNAQSQEESAETRTLTQSTTPRGQEDGPHASRKSILAHTLKTPPPPPHSPLPVAHVDQLPAPRPHPSSPRACPPPPANTHLRTHAQLPPGCLRLAVHVMPTHQHRTIRGCHRPSNEGHQGRLSSSVVAWGKGRKGEKRGAVNGGGGSPEGPLPHTQHTLMYTHMNAYIGTYTHKYIHTATYTHKNNLTATYTHTYRHT